MPKPDDDEIKFNQDLPYQEKQENRVWRKAQQRGIEGYPLSARDAQGEGLSPEPQGEDLEARGNLWGKGYENPNSIIPKHVTSYEKRDEWMKLHRTIQRKQFLRKEVKNALSTDEWLPGQNEWSTADDEDPGYGNWRNNGYGSGRGGVIRAPEQQGKEEVRRGGFDGRSFDQFTGKKVPNPDRSEFSVRDDDKEIAERKPFSDLDGEGLKKLLDNGTDAMSNSIVRKNVHSAEAANAYLRSRYTGTGGASQTWRYN